MFGIVSCGFLFLTQSYSEFCENNGPWEFTNSDQLQPVQDKLFESVDFSMSINKVSRSYIISTIKRLSQRNKGFNIVIEHNEYDKHVQIIRKGRILYKSTLYM